MILPGQLIRSRGIFTPFCERQVFNGMSYGLSCAGYDVRLRDDVTVVQGYTTIAATLEHIAIPLDLLGLVKDKSTWARLGIQVQNTVLEPNWKGILAIELTYQPVLTPEMALSALRHERIMRDPAVTDDEKLEAVIRHNNLFSKIDNTLLIEAGTPIAQVLIFQLVEPAEHPYSGKYQGQTAHDLHAKLELV